MAKIIVNGEQQDVSLPLNVAQLLQLNQVEQPERVSVQVNEEFADRGDWEKSRSRKATRWISSILWEEVRDD